MKASMQNGQHIGARSRTMVALALLAAAGLATVSPARARPEVVATDATFERRLEAAMRAVAARRLDVIVAIAHRGGPPTVRELGSPARDDLAGARTLIDVNSITKTFTGVMAAALVQRGKLALDTQLRDVFPSVPADKASITLHQLLTHTAGLPESIGEDAACIDRADFLSEVFRTPLLSAPGAAYAYSNTGYGVVAAIIELRAGKRYEDFLRDDVLAGHELDDTGYAAAYDDARSLRAHDGATIRSASWGGHDPGWNLTGNGGLISTVTDLIAFRHAFTEGRLVSTSLRDLIQTPHVREEDADSFYGYGVVVQDVPGLGRTYGHDGGNDVFSAHWVDFADQGDVVVTAGIDGRHGTAIDAMAIIARELYPEARR